MNRRLLWHWGYPSPRGFEYITPWWMVEDCTCSLHYSTDHYIAQSRSDYGGYCACKVVLNGSTINSPEQFQDLVVSQIFTLTCSILSMLYPNTWRKLRQVRSVLVNIL